MAIIELAHVKLLGGISISDSRLRQNMQKVTEVIEGYNHLKNLFYVEVEDPSILYVVGAWESQEQHQKGFNGSEDQRKILELVKDQMDIDWMYYLDVEQSRIPLDAPVLEISKYTLWSNADKERFNKALAEGTRSGGAHIEGSVGCWNLPKSDEEEAVWVQFYKCKGLEHHAIAAGGDHAVQSLVEKVDVKHAKRVHLP